MVEETPAKCQRSPLPGRFHRGQACSVALFLSRAYSQGGGADPIFTAEAALERCLSVLPAGTVPTLTATRLMPLSDFDGRSETEGPDFETHVPVWVVGLIAPGLTRADLSQLPGVEIQPIPVAGALCVWDANSGEIVALGSASEQDVIDLSLMLDAAMTVEPATDVPPAPTVNPTFVPPEPTLLL